MSWRQDYSDVDGLAPLRDPVSEVHRGAVPVLQNVYPDDRRSLGIQGTVRIIRGWLKQIRNGKVDPVVYFETYKNMKTLKDAYMLLNTDPGMLQVTSREKELLIKFVGKRLIKGHRKPDGGVASKKDPLMLHMPYHPVFDDWDRRILSKKSEIVKGLAPDIRKHFPPMITYSYDVPLYPQIANNWFDNKWGPEKMQKLLRKKCVCQTDPRMKKFLHPATKIGREIHVMTPNCDLARLYSDELADLLDKGAQYRAALSKKVGDLEIPEYVDKFLKSF